MADKLLDEYEATDLVAALLNDVTRDNVKVKITPERPLSRHGHGHGGGHRNDRRGGGHGGHYKGSKSHRNGDRNNSGRNRGHYEGNKDHKHSEKHSSGNGKKRRFTIKNS